MLKIETDDDDQVHQGDLGKLSDLENNESKDERECSGQEDYTVQDGLEDHGRQIAKVIYKKEKQTMETIKYKILKWNTRQS